MSVRARLLVAAVIGLLALAPAVGANAAPAAVAASPCDSIQAEIDALNVQIDAHNASPLDTTNAAAVAAFNSAADALNEQGDALATRFSACLGLDDQAGRLAASTVPGDYSYTPSTTAVDNVDAAAASITRPMVAGTPTARGTYRNPEGLGSFVNTLRRNGVRNDGSMDSAQLQGQPRPSVGDVDPAFPNATIRAGQSGRPLVEIDHVVPIVEIVNLPGFWQLTSRNMLVVTNAPINLQWLSRAANRAKGGGPLEAMRGVRPEFLAGQQALATTTRADLEDLIETLLQQQATT